MPRTTRNDDSDTQAVCTKREYLQCLRLDQLPELIPVGQVMDLLGISRQLAHRLIERGDLSAIRLGPHTVRVFRASLVDYLQRSMVD